MNLSWPWSWSWDNAAVLILAAILAVSWLVKKSTKAPPGPRGLPILGNLPFFDPSVDYFAKLTQTYGPIFKLQLGRKVWVMVNSPSLAKKVLKDHDALIYQRDPLIATLAITYGGDEIGTRPRDQVWRHMRKLCVGDYMGAANLKSCDVVCREEVVDMVKDLYTKVGSAITLAEVMFLTTLNATMCTLWGATLRGEEKYTLGLEMKSLIEECILMFETPNISDYFPMLARFDLQGVEAKAKKLFVSFDKILESFMGSRLAGAGADNCDRKVVKNDNFLQLLLDLRQQNNCSLTNTQIKAMFLDMLFASTDTSTVVLEWAMTELLQHPEMMKKACSELEQVVLGGAGSNFRSNSNSVVVEESHLPKLHYLHAIIKESMRFHPPSPIILRKSPGLDLAGYRIPKNTRILINTYALHMNPQAWENPSEFNPDRFLNVAGEERGDYLGHNFNFLPFGSGRRVCLGISLVEKMVPYMLANMLLHFNWSLPPYTELDLSHDFGVVLRKSKPLVCVPTPK